MSKTNGTHPTEQEMREAKVPTLDTPEELVAYITTLTDRPHDYGTSVYAMSMAATAAFNYVARKVGSSGFQASCADLDVLRRTRRIKGPFRITDYADLLYPQYLTEEQFPSIRHLEAEHAQWLADEARKLIAESPKAHPDVTARWQYLAAQAPPKGTTQTTGYAAPNREGK